jgi:hypothetical protein
MLTKLYIGADCIDIQEKINLQYSVCDWKEFDSGGANNSFNFKVPLVKLNSFILKKKYRQKETCLLTAFSCSEVRYGSQRQIMTRQR